jgi:transcription elongation factor GreA
MAKFIYMSRDGIDKLTNELKRLLDVELPLVSQKIATARGYGDIAENAEYDVAREEMDHLQRRIARLQDTLSRAQLFDPQGLNPEVVTLLSTVQLQDLKKKKKVTYTLVSAEEVDVEAMRISIQSPIGRALVGKKAGDRITVEVPAGVLDFKILSVTQGSERI